MNSPSYKIGKLFFLAALIFSPAVSFSDDSAQNKAADVSFLKDLNAKVKQVIQKCTPATVAILSPLGTTGSGVLISKDGLILTASHVIQGTDEVGIVFPNGKTEKGKVLGANYTRDAAMVKLEGKGPWPFVSMGDADKLKIGDYVVSLGHSKGFDPNRRPPGRFGRLLADSKQRFMMTDCTLIGGDSGGPLFNLKGELVGIHSSIGPNVAINNHVPLSAFKADWKSLLDGKQWGKLGLNPMVDPDFPLLGFYYMDSRSDAGVVVGKIIRNSPAEKAGLLRGDLITQIGGRPITSSRDFQRELERYKPDETTEIILVRNQQTYKTPFTFGRRENTTFFEQ